MSQITKNGVLKPDWLVRVVIVLVLGGVIWWVQNLWTSHDRLKDYVYTEFATKDDIERLEVKIDRILEREIDRNTRSRSGL